MARPKSSKYDRFVEDGGLASVRIMRMNGLRDNEIIQHLGITTSTFYKWRNDHSEFSEALKIGQSEAIADAIQSLISKFKKTTLTETRVEEWTDKDGNKRTHVIRTTKEIPPDTAAIIFFLKAKAGWRDNAEVIDTSDTDKVFEMLRQTQQMAEAMPEATDADNVQPETA